MEIDLFSDTVHSSLVRHLCNRLLTAKNENILTEWLEVLCKHCIDRNNAFSADRFGRTDMAKDKNVGSPQLTKEDIPTLFYKHYPAYVAG